MVFILENHVIFFHRKWLFFSPMYAGLLGKSEKDNSRTSLQDFKEDNIQSVSFMLKISLCFSLISHLAFNSIFIAFASTNDVGILPSLMFSSLTLNRL